MEIQIHYLIPDWIRSQIHRCKFPLLPSLRVLRGKQIALFCSHFKWVRASVELDHSPQSTRCKHLINFIISTSIFLFISSTSSAALITWLVMVSHFEFLFWMKYGPASSCPPPPTHRVRAFCDHTSKEFLKPKEQILEETLSGGKGYVGAVLLTFKTMRGRKIYW